MLKKIIDIAKKYLNITGNEITPCKLLYYLIHSNGNQIILENLVKKTIINPGWIEDMIEENFAEYICIYCNHTTIIHFKLLLTYLKNIEENIEPFINIYHHFINNLPLIYTFKFNVIYFGKREFMKFAMDLIDYYATYKDKNIVWWNPENQLLLHMRKNNIFRLNYHSKTDNDYYCNPGLCASLVNEDGILRQDLIDDSGLFWAVIRGNETKIPQLK